MVLILVSSFLSILIINLSQDIILPNTANLGAILIGKFCWSIYIVILKLSLDVFAVCQICLSSAAFIVIFELS